jgi:hypothetical protein
MVKSHKFAFCIDFKEEFRNFRFAEALMVQSFRADISFKRGKHGHLQLDWQPTRLIYAFLVSTTCSEPQTLYTVVSKKSRRNMYPNGRESLTVTGLRPPKLETYKFGTDPPICQDKVGFYTHQQEKH